MNILVCGGRDFCNYLLFKQSVIQELQELGLEETNAKKSVCFVHGGAQGADALCARFAEEFRITVNVFKADWRNNGRAAGMIRNTEMLKHLIQSDDSRCLAFWDGQSRGTKDMIKKCRGFNIPTKVVNY